MVTSQFGLMGLGVMGQNLVLNIERNGYSVAVWNRRTEEVDQFLQAHGTGRKIVGTPTGRELVASLSRPRRIMMMVKAGSPVDWTIDQVRPYLESGDILIDGGNSHFEDTRRREESLSREGIRFIGAGVSGGESGALWGPSLMPGGRPDAYREIRMIFEAVAAKVSDGPCVTYIGPNGSGHYVKMVHNGIEYGDMQLIAEAYHLMRSALGLRADQLADIFNVWNEGILKSFLIEITSKILTVNDPETGAPLVDLVLDKAGQKGTGRWAASVALELGVAVPTIIAAIDARVLSSMKDERVAAARLLKGPVGSLEGHQRDEFIDCVQDALYASKICSYAQGMALISAGSRQYDWGVNLSELGRIWKGGCIIRAQFLDDLQQAYRFHPDLPNLMVHSKFTSWMNQAQDHWRQAIEIAQRIGIPVPAMSASLAYYDSYRSTCGPQNLTQAQRDYFGSHMYERVDRPELGLIHTDWIGLTSDRPDHPAPGDKAGNES